MWKDLKDTVRTDGTVRPNIEVSRVKGWMLLRLPSGRHLSYPGWKPEELSFLGINQFTRKWERITTFGGRLLENLAQACSNDVLFYAIPEVEARGYQTVCRIHDELITVAPDTPKFNAEDLSAILAKGFSWTAGLPLAAAGYEAKRYRKG